MSIFWQLYHYRYLYRRARHVWKFTASSHPYAIHPGIKWLLSFCCSPSAPSHPRLHLTPFAGSVSAKWTARLPSCRENVRSLQSLAQLDPIPLRNPSPPPESGNVYRAQTHAADPSIPPAIQTGRLTPALCGKTAQTLTLNLLTYLKPQLECLPKVHHRQSPPLAGSPSTSEQSAL